MKTKILIFSILLFATLIIPKYSFAAGIEINDILDDGTVEITYVKPDTPQPNIEIPSEIEDNGVTYTVTKIAESAFEGNTDIESIIIPNSVTEIGIDAFNNCRKLKSIIIPESMKLIGDSAFFQCKALKSIVIPSKVEMIGASTFYECTDLQNVEILDGVKNIGAAAFWKCSSLEKITIPETVTSIDDMAFLGVSNLTIHAPADSYAVNYAKSKGIAYVEHDIPISKCTLNGLETKIYTGKEIKPNITLEYNGIVLEKETDYTVSYNNNINAGTANVTITGKGNYTGITSKTFKILEKNITEVTVTVDTANKTYTGKALTTAITLKDGNTILKNGTDYTVSYKNNVNAGTANVTITGKENYTGIISKTFKIVGKDLSKVTVTVDTANKTYTGKALTTAITLKDGNTILKNGTDYTVSYKNNINAGTATVTITGKGNYTGIISKTFKIVGKDLSKVTVTVDTTNKTYTGKAITTEISIKDGNTILKSGTDYTVSYKNNINAGTANVTITGKGNYTGSISKTFKIVETSKPNTDEGTTQPSNPGTDTTTKYKLGDVTNDGKINTRDAREVLLSYIGKKTLTKEQREAADVNKDGKVNTKDARQILLYYIGKINKF